MPARQPFTALCRAASAKPAQGRADLHLHTTFSDGTYTPKQIVDLARRSGLAAIAITDHDTLDGIAPAQTMAGTHVEIIPGIEITAKYRGREFHLLGYFVSLDHEPLNTALDKLRAHRVDRFWEMVERLRKQGVDMPKDNLRDWAGSGVLGRRNLAVMLTKSGKVGSIREAFSRYLGDGGRVVLPKLRLPVNEAIDLVRQAGGVTGWAHPSYDCRRESLAELSSWGLAAIEAEYPTHRPSRCCELKALAAQFGLVISGGSDCHGPEPIGRSVGACTISSDELDRLRERVGISASKCKSRTHFGFGICL
jgi:predicted metal-dependent phosphoesterase TrpH